MKADDLLTCIAMSRSDEAADGSEALDRAEVRLLKVEIGGLLSSAEGYERKATYLEKRLAEINEARGWVDAVDADDEEVRDD